MELQDAYDRMVEYFSREEAVLARDNATGQCSYYTGSGCKCAVGCLFPDDLAKLLRENDIGSVGDLRTSKRTPIGVLDILGGREALGVVKMPESEGWEDPETVRSPLFMLLSDAQRLHDSVAVDAQDFTRLLTGLAYAYGLTVEAVGRPSGGDTTATKGYNPFTEVPPLD